jgi:hypothetical protein
MNSLSDLIERINRDPGLYTIKLGTLFSFQILEKMKDIPIFTSWMAQLTQLFEIHADACIWILKYLTNHKDLIYRTLLENTNLEVREAFQNLLITAIGTAAKNEEAYFDEEIITADVNEDDELIERKQSKSALFRFMNVFFEESLDTV